MVVMRRCVIEGEKKKNLPAKLLHDSASQKAPLGVSKALQAHSVTANPSSINVSRDCTEVKL